MSDVLFRAFGCLISNEQGAGREFRRLFALRGGAFVMNASGPGGRAQGRWGVGEGCRRILLSDVAFLVCIPAGRKESVGGGGSLGLPPFNLY